MKILVSFGITTYKENSENRRIKAFSEFFLLFPLLAENYAFRVTTLF